MTAHAWRVLISGKPIFTASARSIVKTMLGPQYNVATDPDLLDSENHFIFLHNIFFQALQVSGEPADQHSCMTSPC